MHRFTLLSSLFSLLNFVLCPVLYQGDGNRRKETVAFPLARIGEFREDSIVEEGDKAGNGSEGSGRETWESSCGRACNHLVSIVFAVFVRNEAILVSFRQTEPSTKTDSLCFSESENRAKPNRSWGGGPTNRESLSFVVVPLFFCGRWVFVRVIILDRKDNIVFVWSTVQSVLQFRSPRSKIYSRLFLLALISCFTSFLVKRLPS